MSRIAFCEGRVGMLDDSLITISGLAFFLYFLFVHVSALCTSSCVAALALAQLETAKMRKSWTTSPSRSALVVGTMLPSNNVGRGCRMETFLIGFHLLGFRSGSCDIRIDCWAW